MGKTEQGIFKQAELTKERLPAKIENAPTLIMGLELYMNGFYMLQSTRGAAYASEGPIPWLAMRDYCNEYRIVGDQRQDFYDLIARMDHAYLDYKAKRSTPPPQP